MKTIDYMLIIFLFLTTSILQMLAYNGIVCRLTEIEENQGYSTSAVLTEVMRYRKDD